MTYVVSWLREDCVSIHHNTLEACWSNPCDDRALACDDHLGCKQEALCGSAAIFFFAYFFFAFALFRSSRLVSIEGDRSLEGSSAQHANVYLRSSRIHLRDIVVVMGLTT